MSAADTDSQDVTLSFHDYTDNEVIHANSFEGTTRVRITALGPWSTKVNGEQDKTFGVGEHRTVTLFKTGEVTYTKAAAGERITMPAKPTEGGSAST